MLFVCILASTALWCGCARPMRASVVASVVQDVAAASSKQANLDIVRQGTPAYLMLVDGLINAYPNDPRLLISGSRAYASYASTFSRSSDQSKKLYDKAKDYALRALARHEKYRSCQDLPVKDFKACVKSFTKKDVPTIFWAASCWGSWISLNLDSVKALSQLPKVRILMERVLELDETFYYGGPHLFLGIYEATRPGGHLEKAKFHFKNALDINRGNFLMAYVYYAEYCAKRAGNKAGFLSALERVLETPADIVPELTLLNTVAKEKAREMLDHQEDYFFEER